ncbi:MAG: VWA domain-containing protein [Spirochaetes bacterium]|jgi:Ca-activated chloride channel family protein|nr:VWA domain-containing protein [Spirochaetota bacterium]
MSIEHPRILWLLLALIPLAALQFYQFRNGRHDLGLLAGQRRESVLTVYLVKWFFSSLFFTLAMAFAVLALAGFSWGQRSVEEDRSGVDVVFAVDVSRSMRANDGDQTGRIVEARDTMQGIVQDLRTARFGIVVFAGQALRTVPVTEDRVAVDSFIGSLGTEVLSAAGTDLEQGLEAAFAAFPEGANRNRALVLLSDGEQHRGNPMRPAQVAGAAGVPIFTVTFGSPEGSTITLSDGRRLTDAEGNVVFSRADPTIMEDIARASGGSSFRGSGGEAFGGLMREIRGFEERREREGFRLVSVLRFRVFLVLAVIALSLSVFVRVFRWRGVV